MGHKAEFKDRFEIMTDYKGRKGIVRITNAIWKDKNIDVLMEMEEGFSWRVQNPEYTVFTRHLNFSTMGGWFVYYPNEYITTSSYYYYGRQKCECVESWRGSLRKYIPNAVYDYWSQVTDSDLQMIYSIHPDFKYVMKKCDKDKLTYKFVFDLLNAWLMCPEIEGLVAINMYGLIFNRSLYKLTPKKKKEVVNWLLENKDIIHNHITLKDIQTCIKYKLTWKEYVDYWNESGKYTEYGGVGRPNYVDMQYIKKHDLTFADYRVYKDYKEIAKACGHNMKDKYWLYPKDLHSAHAKVLEELNNIKNLDNALIGGIKSNWLKQTTEELVKFNGQVNGYDIFIPDNIEVIQKQCDVLHQCLIRNNYVGKMIDQEIILVFIWKNGQPIATAECYYNEQNGRRYGQFYADEHDRANCYPNEETKVAFESWLEFFEPVKRKYDKTVYYYKQFQSQDDNGALYGFGKYKFEIGKTYSTDFDIKSTEGNQLKATNKVFHFCKDIKEISKHYSGDKNLYCIVQALGPVAECGGAYLSNKIKIVRQLTKEEIKILGA